MKIKSELGNSFELSRLPLSGHKFYLLCRGVFVINIIVLVLLAILSARHWWVVQEMFDKLDATFGIYDVQYLPEMIGYRVKGIFADPDVIQLNIKHIDLQRLEYERYKALEGRREFSYVPAKIVIDKKEYKAKVRLKGDRDIHFDHLNSASYRVKISGDETIFGMKKFSLQKPQARNHIHEWVFLEMMRREGIVTPRYKFINLIVNGRDDGIYAIEEHYSKYLIENNSAREGPIIRFDEDTGTDYLTAAIIPYEGRKWLSKDNIAVTRKAVELMEGFRAGALALNQAFDIKKLAKFFAIADICSSRHAMVSKSLRLYYNPIISRLEPVPFDGHHGAGDRKKSLVAAELGLNEKDNWTYKENGQWFRDLFNNDLRLDRDFIAIYLQTLDRMSKNSYLDHFFKDVDDELVENLATIHSEMAWHDNIFSFGPIPFIFNSSDYYDKAAYIQNQLRSVNAEAYLVDNNNDGIHLEFYNQNPAFPLEVAGAGCAGIELIPAAKAIVSVSALEIYKRKASNIFFKNTDQAKVVDERCLNVFVRYPGIDKMYTIPVRQWRRSGLASLSQDLMRQPPNYGKYDFISRLDGEENLLLAPGQHLIAENLIFNSGQTVSISAGTSLILEDNASIIFRGPVEVKGTSRSPVIFRSKGGGGIAVLEAGTSSSVEHARFENLSNPSENGWGLTGGVTFYESPVVITDVSFSSSKSEDALNIVKSPFSIQRTSFIDIQGDALDVDFGEGAVSHCSFENIGNDAIDVSGTKAILEKIKIRVVGDKAISVGERSSMSGSALDISEAEIGVASKDGSRFSMSDSFIQNTKLGYAAFQKKSEFGPGVIDVSNTIHEAVQQLSAVEENSTLIIDGAKYVGDQLNVRSVLYGNQFGAKTIKQLYNRNKE